ncbi:MAG: RHS repeat-associated core domain-containing protein [Rouxiella aceris]|uniref:RHS repeat-associated core domain-containing protein n=1 Tax=Rouxiella aceris TaxID=2703884 RepID=UPI0028412814|nr:RHS repeat-associated core domain-containing protein [Rouxiella aceris]MDR3434591.1 RHS repeat-associated core domain-containing protein [Rouxiella aceris]
MNVTLTNNRSYERYHYAREGQRLLKKHLVNTKAASRQRQVRYLPGLEVRTTDSADQQIEKLLVISVSGLRILCWQQGKPTQVENKQRRFGTNDDIGSSILELDGAGKVISREHYYPFGGTAVWATRNQTQAGYKTLRYSGKERDASGLSYYGYRYYAPWLMRWLNTDPAGTADGLNICRFVRNNPTTFRDPDGCALASGLYSLHQNAHYTSLATRLATQLPRDESNTFLTTLQGLSMGQEGKYLMKELSVANPAAVATLKQFHLETDAGNLDMPMSASDAKEFLTSALEVLHKVNTFATTKKLANSLKADRNHLNSVVDFKNIDKAIKDIKAVNPAHKNFSGRLFDIVRTVTKANIVTATLEGKGKTKVLRNYIALSNKPQSSISSEDVGGYSFITNGISAQDSIFFPIACSSGNNPEKRINDTEIKLLNAIRNIVFDPNGPFTLKINSLLSPCPSCTQAIVSYTNNLNRNPLVAKQKDKHLIVNMSSLR